MDASTTPVAPVTDAAAPMKSIAELALANPAVSTLVAALKAAGLVDTFMNPGEYTVLAPTNDAFAKLPEGTVENLLKPENLEMLKSILTYHVIPKVANAATVMSMAEGSMVPTLNGVELKFHMVEGKPVFEDAKGGMANVVDADMMASNGVVHAIDAVLMPM
ncbi:MAG: fasciclin domain-containing protein [Candidatus Dojkabacteria bacterium]